MTRVCGTCTACCIVFDIVELSKKAGVPCEHLADGKCGRYETRPDACSGYYCLWMQAGGLELPEWGRPDRTGIVLNSRTGDINARDLIAFEVNRGSSQGYWAQKLLLWLIKKRFLVTVQHGKQPSRFLFRRGDARVG